MGCRESGFCGVVGGDVDGRFTALPGETDQDLVHVLGYWSLSAFQKQSGLLFLLATAYRAR
jgi:hypothetical protein